MGGVRLLEGGTTLPVPEAVRALVASTLTPQDVNLREGWNWWLQPLQRFLASSVEGEQCWIDFYYGTLWSPFFDFGPPPRSDILWVRTGLGHVAVYAWYISSLTRIDTNNFNGGVVAGAYWSVIGPGKNLQLASAPGAYYFAWNILPGEMGFFDQSQYPGSLPEPVTLLDLHDPSFPEDDPNGVILTCKESQNAVGYQLLSGSDPYDVAHYTIVADSNSPPAVSVAKLPSSDAWWTVKARDAYGSTIHADPVRVGLPVGVIAYWKLDEVEGNRAADGAGNHEAIVQGGALWQPASGRKAGALAFDGVDDYVGTDLVLDPAAGPFSVMAWIKGGAPGRVIVSQAGGADWLYLNQYGMLTTGLKGAGRGSKSLTSSAYVLDDQWHRVVLSWDGTNRTLQMDGVQVARDTQTDLAASSGSLNIGAGNTLAPGTFWSGLIDDVRIYDRAVKP